MKRFHVHVAVDDLDRSVRFYSALFGAEPAVLKGDYAKWMLEDPRVNFAISARGLAPGLNHLGLQADSAEELAELERHVAATGAASETETGAACCYARSDKHWTVDPSGIPWESFHTLGDIPVFGEDTAQAAKTRVFAIQSPCCGPKV